MVKKTKTQAVTEDLSRQVRALKAAHRTAMALDAELKAAHREWARHGGVHGFKELVADLGKLRDSGRGTAQALAAVLWKLGWKQLAAGLKATAHEGAPHHAAVRKRKRR